MNDVVSVNFVHIYSCNLKKKNSFQYQRINHFIAAIIISILGKGRFSILFFKNDYLILNYSNISDFDG